MDGDGDAARQEDAVDKAQTASGSSPGPFQDFILTRELAEVYLLMDNLSGSATRKLWDPNDNEAPKFAGAPAGWLDAICSIPWPPHNETRDRSQDIARLVEVRDYLNRRAAPANGMTIAFTVLVSDEASRSDSIWPAVGQWLGDLARRLESQEGKAKRQAKEARKTLEASRLPEHRSHLSRVDLAKIAYPALNDRASEFRRRWRLPPIVILSVWLIITCVVSWNVADGNALLGQLAAAQTDQSNLDTQITNAQNGDSPNGSGKPQTSSISSNIVLQNKPLFSDYCSNVTTFYGKNYYQTLEQYRLCTESAKKQSAVDAAAANLQTWSYGWTWLKGASGFWTRLHIVSESAASQAAASAGNACAKPADACHEIANQQWVTSLLGVLSGSILPIFYGLLGAGAAVVRGLSAKVRDWQLAPRDSQISLIQLALGAVIGACIGLFVTPAGASAGAAAAAAGTDAASAQGLLGPVHLSASALCFIAGFFVEGVFVSLEALMRRLFNIADPQKPPSPQR